jgi:hypothetical protein
LAVLLCPPGKTDARTHRIALRVCVCVCVGRVTLNRLFPRIFPTVHMYVQTVWIIY